MEPKEIAGMLDELVEALRLQANEIDRLLTHIRRVTEPPDYTSRMPAVSAALTRLHLQVKELLKAEEHEPAPSR